MKNDLQGKDSANAMTTQQQVAADLLRENVGFLISPNIHSYALSGTEKAFRDSLIVEYLESRIVEKKLAKSDCAGRLEQAREKIIEYNGQIVMALLNGESEESDYIQNRSDKIVALLAQVEQLEGLAVTKTQKAA